LYEHLGYHREGYRRRHFRRGGETVDVVVMAKLLE
jgi:RimJ/RimL family protein N-acetyltransferase